MAPDVSGWLQIAPDGSKWLWKAPNGSRWLLMSLGGSKYLKMAQSSLMDEDDEDSCGRTPRESMLNEAEPMDILAQPWFWPTVIGGGSALVLVGVPSLLIGTGVLPSPLPKDSVAVEVTLP